MYFCAIACACTGLTRSEEHTSELQSRLHLVCRLLLEKKKNIVLMTASIGQVSVVIEIETVWQMELGLMCLVRGEDDIDSLHLFSIIGSSNEHLLAEDF